MPDTLLEYTQLLSKVQYRIPLPYQPGGSITGSQPLRLNTDVKGRKGCSYLSEQGLKFFKIEQLFQQFLLQVWPD